MFGEEVKQKGEAITIFFQLLLPLPLLPLQQYQVLPLTSPQPPQTQSENHFTLLSLSRLLCCLSAMCSVFKVKAGVGGSVALPC